MNDILNTYEVATAAICIGMAIPAAVILVLARRIEARRAATLQARDRRILAAVEAEATDAAASVPRLPRIQPRRNVVKPRRPIVPPGYTLTHDGTLIRRAS